MCEIYINTTNKYVLKTKKAWSYLFYILYLLLFFFIQSKFHIISIRRFGRIILQSKYNINDIRQKFVECLLFTNINYQTMQLIVFSIIQILRL